MSINKKIKKRLLKNILKAKVTNLTELEKKIKQSRRVEDTNVKSMVHRKLMIPNSLISNHQMDRIKSLFPYCLVDYSLRP